MADRPTLRLDGPSQPSVRPKRGRSGATKHSAFGWRVACDWWRDKRGRSCVTSHSAGTTVRFGVLAGRGCETTGVRVGVPPRGPSAKEASERLLPLFCPRPLAGGTGRSWGVPRRARGRRCCSRSWREPSVIAWSRGRIFGTWCCGCARARRTWSRCCRTAGRRATRSMCCSTVSTSRGARRLDRRKGGRNVERRRESPSEGHRRRGRKSPGIGPRYGRLRARVTERPAGRSVAGPSAAPYWENRAI